jgi:Na+/H+ antiporter NhaD/arsenite permease-like protein
LSALLDNIPMTVAMIPILSYLQLQTWSWVDLLWWALVFGVWFGWNASPIWTTTWVIVMAKSESNKTPISTKDWLLIGLPSTLISLLVASWALIVFSYFSIV